MRGLFVTLAAAVVLMGLWCGVSWGQTSSGALVIVTDPPGAEVSIDGEAVGAAPVKRTLLPGDHLVEAKFAQGKTSQVVKVAAGESAVVNLTPPSATSPTTAPPPPTTAPTTTASAPPPPPPTSTEPPTPERAAPPTVHVIDGDIRSPTHPHRRLDFGYGAGLGLRCSGTQGLAWYGSEGYNGDASASGCGLDLHFVPFDFPYGDLHIDLSFGGPGPFGFHPAFAIGSPWFGVGGRTSPVAMNVRLNLGYTIQTLSGKVDGAVVNDEPENGISGNWNGPELGVGVAASIAVTHTLAIDVNFVGGFDPLGSMTMNVGYPDGAYTIECCAKFEPGTWHFTLTGGIRL